MRAEKPRFFPLAPTQVKGLYEFRALAAIYDHFASLNDPRFGAIRPLDICREPLLLIMERVGDQRLESACYKVNPIRHRFKKRHLLAAMENAGAWLRRFHLLPFLAHTEKCNTHRNDIISAIETFTDYLAAHTPYRQFFDDLRKRLVRAAHDLLPEALPLGLTHRDFAPHNVLVSPEGRVTVFDTDAQWHAPVYADLAHFLVALKLSSPQICSAGSYLDARTLANYEKEFLRGYFGDTPPPTDAIRLFECVWVLEWWVSLAHYRHNAKGVRRALRWCQLHFCSRYLMRYVRNIVVQLDHYARPSLLGVLSYCVAYFPYSLAVDDWG
jgi:hypothetical protein